MLGLRRDKYRQFSFYARFWICQGRALLFSDYLVKPIRDLSLVDDFGGE